MIPKPDPGARTPARVGDLAVGFVRTTWPWILGIVAFLAFVALLLWGANRPDDPSFTDDPGAAPVELLGP